MYMCQSNIKYYLIATLILFKNIFHPKMDCSFCIQSPMNLIPMLELFVDHELINKNKKI